MALLLWFADGTQADTRALEQAFTSPSESAKPWTFWYWLDAAVTAEGITADLESMRDAGLGGAYLMPIYGPQDPPAISPPATQLSPHWWKLVRHAAEESDRLGLRLAMHLSDGFALAGGPWITPELSMQQLVWSRAAVAGGKQRELELEQPLSREGFYRDIAVLAFPAPAGEGISTATAPVTVTTNAAGQQSQQLVVPGNTERLRSAEPCWIAFRFEEPFTCRSVTIRPDGNNHQCQRLRLEASDDGLTFRPVARLSAPRHGWQEEGRPVTHAVPTTTARRFRLVFDPAGAEPGAEDLDGAKWSPVLKVQGIELSSAARVHQFRGKSGEVWRVTSPKQHSNPLAGVSRQSIVDLTNQMDDHGVLRWDAPPGEWVVLRFGHTSTGKRNATGGGAQGLECDKLNPQAVREQYQGWFGEARRRLGSELAGKVLTRLHVDSWECGSQNWTADMPQRFAKRRGYDATRWLPAVAGYVIDDGESSERFLHDFRLTIAEQLDESFFGTLESLADDAGVEFSAECTAPTMLGDGLRHFQHVDMPMGEFWRDSPTHDKPNDIRDAVSAGHIYGKHVIGAEAFTQLRIGWDETPNILRPLADRHFCLGVNQLMHHVWMHNPWFDRKPGVTLNGIGTFLQRDQVWQAQAHAWNGYLQRLQAVLRQGDPVVDIAVFTGEELPSRAVLPERLVSTLPGLIGKKRLASETERLANRGALVRELPAGVKHSANMTDPADWLDPLRGYQYDSINRDALLRLAKVRGDRIVLPGGASYAVLVIPAARPMSPAPGLMSVEVAEKLLELADAGGKLLLGAPPKWTPSLTSWEPSLERLARLAGRLADHPNVTIGAWRRETLDPLGVGRDLQAWDREGSRSSKVAWTHRRGAGWDAYLIVPREPVRVATRADRRHSQVWDPVTGERRAIAPQGGSEGWGFAFAANQSVLLVCSDLPLGGDPYRLEARRRDALKNDKWQVGFESAVGASPSPIELSRLADLSEHNDPAVRAFAGTAVYASTFANEADDLPARRVWLDLGEIAGMARVKVNGSDCGVAWTPPYRVEVTDALHAGENQLEVEVAGVWRNRILADQELPEHERLTWTNPRALPESAGPVPFGLLGPVRLETMTPQAERPQE